MIPMMVWFDDLEIGGREPASSGIVVTDKGIDSWYDLPGVKTAVEERIGADGAFPVKDRDVLYSARTVTFNLAFIGDTREEAVAIFNRVNAMNHKIVRARVLDVDDTWIEGWIESTFPPDYSTSGHFAVTVHAQDPRRYSTDAVTATAIPYSSGGGFGYPVVYPIRYQSEAIAGNGEVAAGTNIGTATSWPVITVTGKLPDGFLLLDAYGRSIKYDGAVNPGSPVVVDCRRRVVTVDGVNRSVLLSRREWFEVPAGGSSSISLVTSKSDAAAFANVDFRSAWI